MEQPGLRCCPWWRLAAQLSNPFSGCSLLVRILVFRMENKCWLMRSITALILERAKH